MEGSIAMEEVLAPSHHDSAPPDSELVDGGNADAEMDLSDDDSKPFAWHLRQNHQTASDGANAEQDKAEKELAPSAEAANEEVEAVKVQSLAPKFVTSTKLGTGSRMGAKTCGSKAVALPPRPPPIKARSSRQKTQAAPKPADSASAMPSSSWPMEHTYGASPLVSASPVEGITATLLPTSISQGIETSRQLTGSLNDHAYADHEDDKGEISSEDDEEKDGNGETSKRRVVVEEDEKLKELWRKGVEEGILAVKGKDLNELRELLPLSRGVAKPQAAKNKHAAVIGVSQASAALSRLYTLFHTWPQPSLVRSEEPSPGEDASDPRPSAFLARSLRIQQERENAILSASYLEQERYAMNAEEPPSSNCQVGGRAPLFLPHSSSSDAIAIANHRSSSEPQLAPYSIPSIKAEPDPALAFPPGINKGFLFNYSLTTMQQAVKRAKYGAKRRDIMADIGRDTMIFFWNFDHGMLHGAFHRNGEIEELSRDSWRVGAGCFEWSCRFSKLGPDLPFIPAEMAVPLVGMQESAAREGMANKLLNQTLTREQCVQLWEAMVNLLHSDDGKRKWSTEAIYESSSSIAELEPAGLWIKRVPEASLSLNLDRSPEEGDKERRRKDHGSSRGNDKDREWEKEKEREKERERDRRSRRDDDKDEERRRRREKEEREREERDREDRERERRRKRDQEERDRELRRERERRRDRSREREGDRGRGRDRETSEEGRKRRSDRRDEEERDGKRHK